MTRIQQHRCLCLVALLGVACAAPGKQQSATPESAAAAERQIETGAGPPPPDAGPGNPDPPPPDECAEFNRREAEAAQRPRRPGECPHCPCACVNGGEITCAPCEACVLQEVSEPPPPR